MYRTGLRRGEVQHEHCTPLPLQFCNLKPEISIVLSHLELHIYKGRGGHVSTPFYVDVHNMQGCTGTLSQAVIALAPWYVISEIIS